MSENLKQMIAKIKEQNSQASDPKVPAKPVKKAVPQETEEYDEEDLDEDEEMPEQEQKPAVKPQKQATEPIKEEMSAEDKIAMEIEMLQNNGRFRAELLHQLQGINRALTVIAGVLVDLDGNGKETA